MKLLENANEGLVMRELEGYLMGLRKEELFAPIGIFIADIIITYYWLY